MSHFYNLFRPLIFLCLLVCIFSQLTILPVAIGQHKEVLDISPRKFLEEQSVNQIKAMLDQQQTSQALSLIDNFLNNFPNSSFLDEVTFLHAVALYAKGKTEQASIILEQFLEEYTSSVFIDDARLMLGTFYIESKKSDQAITILKNTLSLSQDQTTRIEAIYGLRKAYEQKGLFAQAIQSALTEIEESPETEKEVLFDYIKTVILQKMDERSLNDLLDTFSNRFPGDLVLIRLIELYTFREDEILAEQKIRAFLDQFPNHPYTQTATVLLQSFIAKIKAHQYVIAAVFPFSGEMKLVGTDAINGIRLALEEGKAELSPYTLGLVVKNTVQAPEQLHQEFSQLLKEFKPLALIGPLLAHEVKQVADLADTAEVPFITPTAMLPDVKQFGKFWFSTAFTTRVQIKNIVDFTMQNMGYNRFCVFYPNSAYGKQLSSLFQKKVAQNGGEIIAVESYQPGTTDASAEIKQLKNKDLSFYGKMLPLEQETLEPSGQGETQEAQLVYNPGFDAIFLPGRPIDVAFLSAQLAFYDIKAPLIGSNAWNHPDLLKWGRSTIEGGTFGDILFLKNTDLEARKFIHNYRERFHVDPSIFSVQAYDAMHMIIDSIKNGTTTGKELRDQLFIRFDLPTLNGLSAFGEDGVLDRKGHIMQIQNGKFVKIN